MIVASTTDLSSVWLDPALLSGGQAGSDAGQGGV